MLSEFTPDAWKYYYTVFKASYT